MSTERNDGAKRETVVANRAVADGGTEPETVVVTPNDLPERDGHPDRNVGGVLLAAGPGERYEGDRIKLLAEVDGTPIVAQAAKALVESELDEVAVVVGHEADAVREALAALDVTIVENEQYREGQSTSMQRGVETARDRGWDALVFGLGDMPFLDPAVTDLLLRAYDAGYGPLIAAGFEGKRGNPTLFDEASYDDLMAVNGDTGGRPVLMGSSSITVVETGEPGVLQDIDTQADYDSYR
ncbi:MAG: molybdenum cofactor cytidylyltransferase [Natronomonas sp.]|jgi:molybdenum cofactor cytidylyltransferase